MKHPELTGGVQLAKNLPMQANRRNRRPSGRRKIVAAMWMGSAMAASGLLSGCVSVNAPDKPIVIELNINIKHELIVQLSEDAKKTIDQHKDIF